LPAFIDMVAWGTLRARLMSSVRACSAVVTALPVGVFMTTMPRLEAAGTSTLSTPIPARPITRSLSAASITFLVTFEPLRTTSASKPAIFAASSASLSPGAYSTVSSF
jgi:hypothetical protein